MEGQEIVPLQKMEADDPVEVIEGELVDDGPPGIVITTWIERAKETNVIRITIAQEWYVAASKDQMHELNSALLAIKRLSKLPVRRQGPL